MSYSRESLDAQVRRYEHADRNMVRVHHRVASDPDVWAVVLRCGFFGSRPALRRVMPVLAGTVFVVLIPLTGVYAGSGNASGDVDFDVLALTEEARVSVCQTSAWSYEGTTFDP